MTLGEPDVEAFCLSLPGAGMAVQRCADRVFEVASEMFAVVDGDGRLSFHCSDAGFHILAERDGVIPAPDLARARWVTLTRPDALDREELLDQLRLAYGLVVQRLPAAERGRLIAELRARTGRPV